MTRNKELPIPDNLDGTIIRDCDYKCGNSIVISPGETWKRIGECSEDCPYPIIDEMPPEIAFMQWINIKHSE